MAKNIYRTDSNTLIKTIEEYIKKELMEAYYGNDATPEQFVNTADEISNTYNDSEVGKNGKYHLGRITTMNFIRLMGGLEKIGNMPVDQLMKMLNNYITPEQEPIDFDTNQF